VPGVVDLPVKPSVVEVPSIRPIAAPAAVAAPDRSAKLAVAGTLDAQHYPAALRKLAEDVVALKSDNGCLRLLLSSPQRLARDNFAAVNLARLLQLSGHQTILIDGNLRAPRLSTQLDLGNGAGFSDLLAGQSNFADVIHRDPRSRMHVIAAGQVKADAGTLMGEGRVERLLDALEGNYAFIIIDLPPVMLSPEPRALAGHADLAVLVEDTLPGAQRLATRAADMLRDQNRIPIDVLQVGPEIGAEIRSEELRSSLRIA
jgi:Mrp family chromosome partitioning ATPase